MESKVCAAAQQRIEWQSRLIEQVMRNLRPGADDETLAVLLLGAFQQAHDDGMAEATGLLRSIAEKRPGVTGTATFFADIIDNLRELNARTKITSLPDVEAPCARP